LQASGSIIPKLKRTSSDKLAKTHDFLSRPKMKIPPGKLQSNWSTPRRGALALVTEPRAGLYNLCCSVEMMVVDNAGGGVSPSAGQRAPSRPPGKKAGMRGRSQPTRRSNSNFLQSNKMSAPHFQTGSCDRVESLKKEI
jgi:hypothetical protein